MAEHRYSPGDRLKRDRDRMADLRAKGLDVRGIHPLHPGGTDAVLRFLETETNHARDQKDAQREIQ